MQEFKVTTPGPDGHYHIVYINSETGAAAMSAPVGKAKDTHTHQVIYDPPREPVEEVPAVPPQIDPMTGQPVMVQDPNTGQVMPDPGQPGQPADPGKEAGSWIIRPMVDPETSEPHDHEIVDYKVNVKEKKADDKKTIEECLCLWREALAIVSDCKKKGKESEDFYKGKQWDAATEQMLNSLDRAALTINEIAPNIDTLIGYQMEQRTDIKYLPQEGGDQRVADMLNIISKKLLDGCYFPREETKVFKDICVPGFGAFNVFMDFKENIQGDIKIERFPWTEIVYGPHEKEDLSDCEYEIRSRMQSIATLKYMFGKKAQEIEKNYESYKGQYPDVDKSNGINGTNTDYRSADKVDDINIPFTVDGAIPLVDIAKKEFRLVQVTRKTYKEVTVVFNEAENFFFTAYDWEEKDIAAASTMPGFQSFTQMKTRMRITKFCGSVVVSDEDPADLPLHDFYTVPVYGYRQNGEYWGKVEAAKDPQRELNKRRSQVMDTMNRLGASVYYTEPGTFTTPQERERFKKNRSKPGAMFDVNDVGRPPVLEKGADVPNSLVQIMQLDQQNLQRLMNVVVEQTGANESGALFLEKKKGRLTGNQFLFDNLSFAKQKLGKLIVALIQRYYPAPRLQRLLNSQYAKQKFQIGGEDFSKFTEGEIIEMLEDADLTDYDVIVTESSFAASTRLGIAKVLFELIQQGANIPPELPLEFVDMPADTRARISEQLQMQAESSQQAQSDISNAEIVKTVIAKGQYTIDPQKAQELGLVPLSESNNPLANGGENPNNQDNSQGAEYANNLASALAG